MCSEKEEFHDVVASSPNAILVYPQDLNSHDVLFGHGGIANKHEGNQAYREMIISFHEEYRVARRSEKPKIAERILQTIRSKGGRFFKTEDDSHQCLQEVHDTVVITKTLQTFRDFIRPRYRGVPILRADTRTTCSHELLSHPLRTISDEKNGVHRLCKLPKRRGKKQATMARKCKLCLENGIRHDVTYYCYDCGLNYNFCSPDLYNKDRDCFGEHARRGKGQLRQRKCEMVSQSSEEKEK